VTGETWLVHLTDPAAADFAAILNWTAEQFGTDQTPIYAEILSDAIHSLRSGPEATGAKARVEIGKDIYTIHVARHKRRGRHFILFRARREMERAIIEVLRILHDSMELSKHAPPNDSSF
jgi:toxin ParE1/3/4